jgi:hypothetical protein
MNIQKTALWVFFPMMFACAFTALLAVWFGEQVHDDFFRLIPSFFIPGLSALITWAIMMILEFRDIAKGKK